MLLAYVMVSLALFASLSWGAETVTVDKTFHGREIKVRAGATIRVQFEQAGATGYEWQVRDLDGEFFEVLTVRTEGPSASEVTGAPVTKVWVIKAKKAGRSQLKFVYYRSWEGEQSEADAFELKVRIP
jgi:predicted secreted protein